MSDDQNSTERSDAISELIKSCSGSMKAVYKSQIALSSKIRLLENYLNETKKLTENPAFDDFYKVTDHLKSRLTTVKLKIDALNMRIDSIEKAFNGTYPK